MTIRRSFKILEIDHGATEDDAKQAYKDIVNVWHPDRFSSNPRLKQKAEHKLKEANVAYEHVKAFFKQREQSNGDLSAKADNACRQTRQSPCAKGEQPRQPRPRAEIAAEVGTTLVLGFYAYVSTRLHHLIQKDGS